MRQLARTGRRRKLRLPVYFPLFEPEGRYLPSDLAKWLESQLCDIGGQFDRRNGNTFFSGSLMAGQSVGMVTKEEPVTEIIAALLGECEAALSRR